MPLESHAGATIARVIVDKRIPAILDCGLMRKGERIRFMTDFCETLYHANREALHFVVDEAQTIAPQNLRAMPEAARLLGAMEDIMLQGRRRGLGLTVISPRPAVVNTNLRSACEVIIAMQIVAPHDRKAISEWVDLHGDDKARAEEMMGSLASLKRGEAWLWSPSWLELFRRVTFRPRETFDSSATPKVGQRVIVPKRMAEVELQKLGAEIAATVERAKADDPKELRRQMAGLQQQIAQLGKRPAKAEVQRVEVPTVGKADLAKLEKLVDRLEGIAGGVTEAAKQLRAAVGKAAADPPALPRPAIPVATRSPQPRPKPAPLPHTGDDGALSPTERAVLAAIAQFPSGARSDRRVFGAVGQEQLVPGRIPGAGAAGADLSPEG